jgi:hypothetical protein
MAAALGGRGVSGEDVSRGFDALVGPDEGFGAQQLD